MIEDEIDAMMQEFSQQLSYQGMTLEQYLGYLQKDQIAFRGDLREEAIKKVKTRMLISKIADQEAISVAEEELDRELAIIASHYKTEASKLKESFGPQQLSLLEKDIKMRKAVDLIFEMATIK
jgi:trigger factor